MAVLHPNLVVTEYVASGTQESVLICELLFRPQGQATFRYLTPHLGTELDDSYQWSMMGANRQIWQSCPAHRMDCHGLYPWNTTNIPITVDNLTLPSHWHAIESIFNGRLPQVQMANIPWHMTSGVIRTTSRPVSHVIFKITPYNAQHSTNCDVVVPYLEATHADSGFVTQLFSAMVLPPVRNSDTSPVSVVTRALQSSINQPLPAVTQNIALVDIIKNWCHFSLGNSILHINANRFVHTLTEVCREVLNTASAVPASVVAGYSPYAHVDAYGNIGLTTTSTTITNISGSATGFAATVGIDSRGTIVDHGPSAPVLPNNIDDMRKSVRRSVLDRMDTVLPLYPYDTHIVDALCDTVRDMFHETFLTLEIQHGVTTPNLDELRAELKAAFLLAIIRA